MKVLVAKDSKSKTVFAHAVVANGSDEDGYAVSRLVEDIAWLGHTTIIFKSDNAPAIVHVLKEVLESLEVSSMDQATEERPAPYDSKGDGAVENAIKHVH